MIGIRYGRGAAVALACLALATSVAACGGGGESAQQVQQQVAAALKKQAQQQKIKDLQSQVNQIKHGQTGTTVSTVSSGSSSGSSSSGDSCGGGVSAGANTTCGFAEAVASAYRESGSSVVRAVSPTTHQSYAMSCSGTNPVVCRGGNDASVYIY